MLLLLVSCYLCNSFFRLFFGASVEEYRLKKEHAPLTELKFFVSFILNNFFRFLSYQLNEKKRNIYTHEMDCL